MQLHRQNLPTLPHRLRRRRRAATPIVRSPDLKRKNTRTGPDLRRSFRSGDRRRALRTESRGCRFTRTKVRSTAWIRRGGGVKTRGTAHGIKAAAPCGTKRTATWSVGTLSWITTTRTWMEISSVASVAVVEYASQIHESGRPCDACMQRSRTPFGIFVLGNIEALRVAACSYVENS